MMEGERSARFPKIEPSLLPSSFIAAGGRKTLTRLTRRVRVTGFAFLRLSSSESEVLEATCWSLAEVVLLAALAAWAVPLAEVPRVEVEAPPLTETFWPRTLTPEPSEPETLTPPTPIMVLPLPTLVALKLADPPESTTPLKVPAAFTVLFCREITKPVTLPLAVTFTVPPMTPESQIDVPGVARRAGGKSYGGAGGDIAVQGLLQNAALTCNDVPCGVVTVILPGVLALPGTEPKSTRVKATMPLPKTCSA